MSIKFLVLREGGVFWVFLGGSADFIFMGARIFLIKSGPKTIFDTLVFLKRVFRHARVRF